jgi:hypothetical protein
MKLAGRSTVRFYRKHPSFAVQTQLGMTPLSLVLHSAVERSPALLRSLERAGSAHPGLARNIVYQYHYVTGIKDALGGGRA